MAQLRFNKPSQNMFQPGNPDDPFSSQVQPPGSDLSQPPPQQAPPPAPNSALNAQIAGWYNKYLGRGGSDDEISSWAANPGGVSAIEAGIRDSPEGRAYASRQQSQNAAQSAVSGGAAPMPSSGYNAQKWNDPTHLTDKYVVGRILASGGTEDDVWNYLSGRGGYTRIGSDKVRDEHGDEYDFLYDEEGERRPQWTQTYNRSGAQGGSGGGGGGLPSLSPLNPGLTAPGAGSFPNFSGRAGGSMDAFSQRIMQGWQDYLSPEQSDARRAGAIESARETMERGRKVQMRNIQGALADRGLLSESGIVQGPEISSLVRMEESIAPVYSQALRQALSDADQTQLQALQGAGGYQGMVTGLALQELGQDLDFQKFLAGHGLDMARLQFEIENGNINNVLALFQLYLNAAKIAADGFI